MSKFKIERAVPVKVAQIIPNAWNPNRTNDHQQRAIGESLGFYGQVLELLVRPHPEKPDAYEVIDGEHRLQELQTSEVVYVNVIHGLSDAEAQRLTIAMDGSRGEFDKIELAKLLQNIQLELEADTGHTLPYSEAELEELIKLADVDWDNYGHNSGDDEDDDDSDGDDDEESERWVTIVARVPQSAYDGVVKDAYNLVEQERDGLHKDREIAWGVVLESISADYLATPR